MKAPAVAQRDGFARTFASAVRRWYVIPAVLALLGAAVAGYFGSQVRPSAESLISVHIDANVATNLDRVMEGWVRQVGSTAVYQQAADQVGVDPGNLRSRTRIAAVANSQILSVTVSAATPGTAARESIAIADAAVAVYQAGVARELERLHDDTERLMDSPSAKMSNPRAETARVARLGDELGAGQAALISGANEVTVLEAGQPGSIVAGPLQLGAMGFVGGAMLGIGLIVLLATRTPPVRSVRDLQLRYPHLPVLEMRELRGVMWLEADTVQTVVVAVGLGQPAQADYVAQTVRRQLEASGRSTSVLDPDSGQRPHWAVPRDRVTDRVDGAVTAGHVDLPEVARRDVGPVGVDSEAAGESVSGRLTAEKGNGSTSPGGGVSVDGDDLEARPDLPSWLHRTGSTGDGGRTPNRMAQSETNGRNGTVVHTLDPAGHDAEGPAAAADEKAAPTQVAARPLVSVMAVPLNGAVVRRISRDDTSLLLIPVELRNSAGLALLERYAPSLGDRTYLIASRSARG